MHSIIFTGGRVKPQKTPAENLKTESFLGNKCSVFIILCVLFNRSRWLKVESVNGNCLTDPV